MTSQESAKLMRVATLIDGHMKAHKGQFNDGAFCLPVVMLEAAALEIRALLTARLAVVSARAQP